MNSKPAIARIPLWLACLLLAVFAGHAAADTKPAGTNSVPAASTNLIPAEPVIPLSVFTLTNTPTKDPFFPLSARLAVPAATNSVVLPQFSAASFKLQAVSPGLAIINHRTLGVGEDAEVETPTGRTRIHVLEIREASILVSVPGQKEPIEVEMSKTSKP